MQTEVIEVDGKEVVVREDTAKAHRFVMWGYIVAGIGLGIMVVLGIFLYIVAAVDGDSDAPANSINATRE
ncbi:MAG: hypothetical protein JNK51_13700 [Blastocatellia bacterium]|nr:hypothetical protein [Blastocatellia bacterium]